MPIVSSPCGTAKINLILTDLLTMQKKFPCMTFTCSDCRENIKLKEAVVMSGRVRLLEEAAVKTNHQLENIHELLTTLVEKAEGDDNSEENQLKWIEVNKAAIKSIVGVENSWVNKKTGQTMFVCNSEKSKQALLPVTMAD